METIQGGDTGGLGWSRDSGREGKVEEGKDLVLIWMWQEEEGASSGMPPAGPNGGGEPSGERGSGAGSFVGARRSLGGVVLPRAGYVICNLQGPVENKNAGLPIQKAGVVPIKVLKYKTFPFFCLCPLFTLHYPTRLHLQNTGSKIKLLQISRRQQQNVEAGVEPF